MTENPSQRRRERERADRERLIVDSARAIAEAEGWDAVTTRRLADTIEYSQPVLYSHFANRAAIVDAVVVAGAAEFAAALRAAREGAPGGGAGAAAVAQAYLDFAGQHPALYEAMFTLASGLPFGTADAPPALLDAFGELRAAFTPDDGTADAEVLTEVMWSALHGLVVLDRGGRLRPELRDARLPRLLALLGSSR
jgi:AcrR family transcriptional regulator